MEVYLASYLLGSDRLVACPQVAYPCRTQTTNPPVQHRGRIDTCGQACYLRTWAPNDMKPQDPRLFFYMQSPSWKYMPFSPRGTALVERRTCQKQVVVGCNEGPHIRSACLKIGFGAQNCWFSFWETTPNTHTATLKNKHTHTQTLKEKNTNQEIVGSYVLVGSTTHWGRSGGAPDPASQAAHLSSPRVLGRALSSPSLPRPPFRREGPGKR